jgi:hypothetical protein
MDLQIGIELNPGLLANKALLFSEPVSYHVRATHKILLSTMLPGATPLGNASPACSTFSYAVVFQVSTYYFLIHCITFLFYLSSEGPFDALSLVVCLILVLFY